MTAQRQLADPFAGNYSPLLMAWAHDPGRVALDRRATQITHFRQIRWAVLSGAAASNDLERLRACFARVSDGQRSYYGTDERLCVCDALPDDLESISSSGGDHGDPKAGLSALLVDLHVAADAVLLEGLRWPQTEQIFSIQGRQDIYDAYRSRLESNQLDDRFGRSYRPPHRRYVWAVMAYQLGWRGQCRWPNEARRLEFSDRQSYDLHLSALVAP